MIRHILLICKPQYQEVKAGGYLVYIQPRLHSKVLYEKGEGLEVTHRISVHSYLFSISYLETKMQARHPKKS